MAGTPTRRRPLKQAEKDLLRLVERSPDAGDGWRTVSPLLWSAVHKNSRPELLELEPHSGGGGRVRFTPRAKIALDYI